MKFTTNTPAGMAIAERVVSCVSIALDDLHQRTQDRWVPLAASRPHIMNAVILDELRQEFADDQGIITSVNNQLRTFEVPDERLIFRVKKQKKGRLKVAANNTVRDAQWGLNVSQLSLPTFDVDENERLVLSYSVSKDWHSLINISFMEFRFADCVALERLPLISESREFQDDGQGEPDSFKPSIYRINVDKIDRVSQPGLTIEGEYEMGS